MDFPKIHPFASLISGVWRGLVPHSVCWMASTRDRHTWLLPRQD